LGSSAWVPEDRTVHHFSGFVQNDFSLIPEKVLLILGTKIEDNTFSHLEVQPNVRVAWTPTMQHTLWGAVGRAVRVPSRLDTDFRFSPTPGVLAIRGNPDFKPEEVIGAEIGYRMTPRTNLFFDITVFHHSYDSLITVEPGPPGQPSILGNGMNADITGATLIVNFEPLSWVRASSSFTLMDKTLELDPDSRDMSNAAGEGNDPDHYWTLHVMADPIQNFKFDVILRSSGELPSPAVPGYVTMDLRAGWSVTDQLELAIVGQNLFQPSMPEFGAPLPTRREIQRSVYGQATWFF
jgi:iron complex outermembrane recepter protein